MTNLNNTKTEYKLSYRSSNQVDEVLLCLVIVLGIGYAKMCKKEMDETSVQRLYNERRESDLTKVMPVRSYGVTGVDSHLN